MIRLEIGLPIDSETLRPELPDGVTVEDHGVKYFEFDNTGFSLFVFTLNIALNISTNLIANVIYDAIKKKSKEPPTRIIIDEQHVEFDRDKVTRVIQRRIEYHRGTASHENE